MAREGTSPRSPLEGGGAASGWGLAVSTRGTGASRRTNRFTSARKASQTLSSAAPCQWARSAVCVSSNMIGRSQGSIMQGTRVLLRSASVASARTQRLSTDFLDHSTTTALASFSAFSVT